MKLNSNLIKKPEYQIWITGIKKKFRQAQIKGSVQVNIHLLEFYWELGAEIIDRQENSTWGNGFLKQLSKDLIAAFPNMKGFSKRNLEQIRRWYLFWNSTNSIAKQAATQLKTIPWWHNVIIVQKCRTQIEAFFYIRKTIENGWSRSVLTHQLESRLYERSGSAITNFEKTLPKTQSDLAREIVKDPYTFDFLSLTEDINERELEKSLLNHITSFLLELGAGFAFIGKQKTLKVGNREFKTDLLFYHTRLHCYIVIELKTVDFEPEFAGKLNFYIKAVDEQLKTEKDEPTIGILLCKSKDKLVVEYALSDIYKPMAVSEYRLTHTLPEELKSVLPSIEEIEAELNKGHDHEL